MFWIMFGVLENQPKTHNFGEWLGVNCLLMSLSKHFV